MDRFISAGSATMTSRENFRAWFTSQINKLIPDREAGLVMVMIVFPLLERYLRRQTRAKPKSPLFVTGLLKVLPELRTIEAAKKFWWNYRDGLLHNVTMSRASHGLTHDTAIVTVEANGKVWLNPILFAQRVLDVIEADFEVFVGGQPLPRVTVYETEPQPGGAPIRYLGTSTFPWKG